VDCNLVHNNVSVTSVFVDRAGEWKLGGVDFMYPASGPESLPAVKMFPVLEKYDPPERSAGGGKRPSEKWCAISIRYKLIMMVVLIFTVFVIVLKFCSFIYKIILFQTFFLIPEVRRLCVICEYAA